MRSKEINNSKTINREVMNKEVEDVAEEATEVIIIIIKVEEEITKEEVMKIIKNKLKKGGNMVITSNHIKCIEVAREEAIKEVIIVTEAIIMKEVEIGINKKVKIKNLQLSMRLHMRIEGEVVIIEAEEKDAKEETMRVEEEEVMDMKAEEEEATMRVKEEASEEAVMMD
jgi:hypothetical protein